jgi:hypothetical protein
LGDAGAAALAAALAWTPPPLLDPCAHARRHDDDRRDGHRPAHAVGPSWRGPSLRSLDLGFNRVTDVGLAALAHALPANEQLATLDLRKNAVTTVGVEHLCKASPP